MQLSAKKGNALGVRAPRSGNSGFANGAGTKIFFFQELKI